MSRNKPHLPIGYWLKKADEVLTSRINEVQDANGLDRTEWQILNLLHEVSACTQDRVCEVLRPFADADSLKATLERLVSRGFVEGNGSQTDAFRLTDQGRHVHSVALETQKKIRQQAVQGISEAEYVTTVSVLQRLIANLTHEGHEK